MTSEEAGTSGDAGTSVDAGASRAPFDAARPYEKHPQVAIRPESFGALAYHYGNRRLVFLKAPALVTVVETLGDFPSAAAAVAAHVPDAERETYTRALSGLLTSDVIRARLPCWPGGTTQCARSNGQHDLGDCIFDLTHSGHARSLPGRRSRRAELQGSHAPDGVVFTVLVALSGMEREYIRDRTLEGHESARAGARSSAGAPSPTTPCSPSPSTCAPRG